MSRRDAVAGSITGLVALLATVTYLILGFTANAWGVAWVVFLTVPITGIIADIVKNKHGWAGKVTGLVALLCVIIYMVLGFFGKDLFGRALWDRGWIVFFAIPITGIIVRMFTAGRAEEHKADTPESGKE
jgi:uncharacterized membrane protein